MPTYRDEAIVLRTQKLGESDRIITLLTRRLGKVRAVGRGLRCGVVQFGKGAWQTGERTAIERLGGDQVEWHTLGEGFTWETQDRNRDVEAARRAWAKAREVFAILKGGGIDGLSCSTSST